MDSTRPLGTFASETGGRRARTERGASLVEYALLVALIALVCFAAVVMLGGEGSEAFSRVGRSVSET